MKNNLFIALMLVQMCGLQAASSYGPPSSSSSITPPAQTAPKPQQHAPAPKYHPLPKKTLPGMPQPFGMPGVIGLEGNRWVGSDYLGYLPNKMAVDVEISKEVSVKLNIDDSAIRNEVIAILGKEFIEPKVAAEGPPLPLLHVLVFVYPVDVDKYVVVGTCRVLEEIHVVRPNFDASGVWQGVTWENYDVILSGGTEINEKIKVLVRGLVSAFATRYRQYNPLPGTVAPGTPR